MAAQRPVLAIGGSGSDVVKELLSKTNAGVYGSQAEDAKSLLREFYLEYKQRGRIMYNGNLAEIEKYSHKEMAKKIVDILDQIAQKNK